MAKHRKSKLRKRARISLGATPPKFWVAEIEAVCPEGRKTFKLPGPSAEAAVRKAMRPGTRVPGRCRVVSRQVVAGR